MERWAHPFPKGLPAAASLLVNVLLIGALLNLGMGRSSPRLESPALTVMDLAVLKGTEDGKDEAEAAAPSTPSPAPPPPDPAPVSAAKPLAQPVIPVLTIPAALPRPAPAQAAPESGSAAPQHPSPPAQQIATASAPAAPAARRGAADGLDVTAPPGASRNYAAKVRSWLYAHKIYPRRAKMRHEEGKVQVRFVIDRAGVLIEGVIIRGSGNGALDDEAAAMMRRASPFPKAPGDVPGERIEFVAPIEFVLPV